MLQLFARLQFANRLVVAQLRVLPPVLFAAFESVCADEEDVLHEDVRWRQRPTHEALQEVAGESPRLRDFRREELAVIQRLELRIEPEHLPHLTVVRRRGAGRCELRREPIHFRLVLLL